MRPGGIGVEPPEGTGAETRGERSLSEPTLELALRSWSSGPAWLRPAFLGSLLREVSERGRYTLSPEFSGIFIFYLQ